MSKEATLEYLIHHSPICEYDNNDLLIGSTVGISRSRRSRIDVYFDDGFTMVSNEYMQNAAHIRVDLPFGLSF